MPAEVDAVNDQTVAVKLRLQSACQAMPGSLGMHASQIWSTHFLEIDKIFDADVQSRHFPLRFLTKIKPGTSKLALLHELGQRPLQFNWWKAVARFWNKIIEPNNHLLSAVMKADADLAQAGVACWTSEVKRRLIVSRLWVMNIWCRQKLG